MILISISFCALVSLLIRLAAFGFDPVECRPPRSSSGSLWLRLSLPVSRARTLASVLVPHIVARFFSTGFRRWTALELRALYMSSIYLGGFPVARNFRFSASRRLGQGRRCMVWRSACVLWSAPQTLSGRVSRGVRPRWRRSASHVLMCCMV